MKVLCVEALQAASAIHIGGTVISKHSEKSKEDDVDEASNRC